MIRELIVNKDRLFEDKKTKQQIGCPFKPPLIIKSGESTISQYPICSPDCAMCGTTKNENWVVCNASPSPSRFIGQL